MISAAKPGGWPRTLNMQVVGNGVLCVMVNRIQWRMLPKEYPAWKGAEAKSGNGCMTPFAPSCVIKPGDIKHLTTGSIDSQTARTGLHNDVHGHENRRALWFCCAVGSWNARLCGSLFIADLSKIIRSRHMVYLAMLRGMLCRLASLDLF